MDTKNAILIFLGIAALLVLAFFSIFRYRGKFSIKTKLGEVSAEGENAPPSLISVEKQSQVNESSTQKIRGGTTEIGQVGTGANVFVAQPGSNIIVQTGERAIPVRSEEKQIDAKLSESTVVSAAETKPTSLPIPIPVKDTFDNECDTPPPTTTWVGRGEELLLMERSETKVIAITGIGGQGKSTLAAKFLVNTKTPTLIQDWRDCKEESNTLHTQLVRI